ncbi:MAG: diguanylate cyclase [Kiritimatiellae bacterium]|nr:diguanylate cyclase [Kiritimatiellia bacterium]
MTQQIAQTESKARVAVPPKKRELEPIRVLVVDDEPGIRRTYELIFRENGWEVELASDGRVALQLLMQRTFDVLVVDLRMEHMDGLSFLQEAMKVWPWLGVIVVSAYVTEQAVREANRLGVRKILEKPVGLRELCESVEEVSASARLQQSELQTGRALALMRDHIRLLTELSTRNLGTEPLEKTLLTFGRSVCDMLNAEVVAILIAEDGVAKPSLAMTMRRPVAREFLSAVKKEMFDRYESLSGTSLAGKELQEEIQGDVLGENAPTRVGHTLSVPFILCNRICGLLTLATEREESYSPADVSLFYHAANHISAVFMSLRRMHRLATRDSLTGVYNRIRLEEELERTWLLSRRYGGSMGVVVVDLDNFKIVNDAHGHRVGDEIIAEFAQLIQSVARTTDIIARYGGDEFVVVLPQADENDARAFAERLIRQAREHVFCRTSNPLRLTISVGVATSQNPTNPSTSSAVLAQADRALYMAKRAGRNRLCIWPGRYFVASSHAEQPADEQPESPRAPHPVVLTEAGVGVMVVDDEEQILSYIVKLLEHDGYSVFGATRAGTALEELRRNGGKYHLLLTDLALPDKDGTELLAEASELDSDLVSVVLTAHATVDNAVLSLKQGAYDFVQKPVSRDHLLAVVRRALEYRELKIENARYQTRLEEMVRERSAQLAKTLEEVKASYEFTLEALVAMLDAREHQTGRHSVRVRELAVTLARQMGIRGKDLEAIACGALLHDIGKIGIPDGILFRPGPLEPYEWKIMEKHSEIGYNVLKASPYLREAAEIVYAHQERYDGKGYPRGLKGNQIPLGARIFAVVDAYDAMRSVRVYRNPVSEEAAVEEIRRNSGTQFDPAVVEAFMQCQKELERILHAFSNGAAHREERPT